MKIEMDDLTELLKRIYEYREAYKIADFKAPLFRITPHEHKLFKEHLINSMLFMPSYYGDLPTYMGVDFELVGAPQLFNGKHIRSDSGINFNKV